MDEDSLDPNWPEDTDDSRDMSLAAAARRPYDGHTIVIDGPVWTDADRDALARKMKIIALKQLDLNISDHRWNVMAAALLNEGWHR